MSSMGAEYSDITTSRGGLVVRQSRDVAETIRPANRLRLVPGRLPWLLCAWKATTARNGTVRAALRGAAFDWPINDGCASWQSTLRYGAGQLHRQ